VSRTIFGQIPSKSNGYRFGKGRVYKSSEVKQYEADFAKQWVRTDTIEGYFELTAIVYFRSDRSDLDGALKCTLDMLQKVGAIKNDNKCIKLHFEKRIDKANPRIELTLKKVI